MLPRQGHTQMRQHGCNLADNEEGDALYLELGICSTRSAHLLRFGEALRIDISNISPDCSTIKICQKAWRGQIHDYLKSESGKREVDLHPTVADMLKDFVGERKSGLLFCNKRGRQLAQSNIVRRSLHPILTSLDQPKTGCRAFRRFRTTW